MKNSSFQFNNWEICYNIYRWTEADGEYYDDHVEIFAVNIEVEYHCEGGVFFKNYNILSDLEEIPSAIDFLTQKVNEDFKYKDNKA